MNAADVVRILRASPFRPFRIQMANGDQFEIRHPEMAIVSSSVIALGLPRPEGGDIAEGIVHLSISHVDRLEEIEQPSPT